ncbi:hypothetical protein Daura_18085 [Dactylosporangium aurantiacum]|uniref:Uncharacterized protein n=1 Tax=Dactylosporangium aurantiacum TaxID=35754 RepID=A0A9Q9IQB3_9ACTN|nr:hypothetical protein [Dactylosporangium aurantiacum]MDG6105921.1 hypothetical protein [Dactylosporangium aurantiacum]UWZ57907.1 hypothetical protein Daura_18085 [Dactylosporangium aurantiacum]
MTGIHAAVPFGVEAPFGVVPFGVVPFDVAPFGVAPCGFVPFGVGVSVGLAVSVGGVVPVPAGSPVGGGGRAVAAGAHRPARGTFGGRAVPERRRERRSAVAVAA